LDSIGREKSNNSLYKFDVYCFDGMEGVLKKYKNVGEYYPCRNPARMDMQGAGKTMLYDESTKKITQIKAGEVTVSVTPQNAFYKSIKALEERINRPFVIQPQPLSVGN